MNLSKELEGPLVQAVYDFIGDPVQPPVVSTLIGHEALVSAPAGMNGFKYAQWIVSYSLRQPTKDIFVRVVREIDAAGALDALHALVSELEADGAKWKAAEHGLWIPAGWPFVDRESLRDTLTAMAAGNGPPTVAIEGAFGEGKRTMGAYVQHLADQTKSFAPVIRELRPQPVPGALFAIASDLQITVGMLPDLQTTHAEPERQATTLAREIALAAPTAPMPIWFVANVMAQTGLEEGLLKFFDELLGLVQSTPEIAQKLRVLVFCDQLSLLELDHPPPAEARYTLPQITDVEVRQWLEAAVPGKDPMRYQLAAETVMRRLENAAIAPATKLRVLALSCKTVQRML